MEYLKLRGKIRETKLTEAKLANLLNISKSSISSRINGKSQWKIDEIEKTCKILNIPVEMIGEYFFSR